MNWDRIEGSWNEFSGKAKQQWGKLTDDDWTRIKGNRQELEGAIQKRYGYEKDRVTKDVDTWMGGF